MNAGFSHKTRLHQSDIYLKVSFWGVCKESVSLLDWDPWSFPSVFLEKLGEGNGTPLQYSCLENPMDGGAW